MTAPVSARELAKNAPRSKDLPWFQHKIGSSLTPAGRKLLEGYSGIAPEDVETHIYRNRDVAWEIFPWPCIGEFWFVSLGLAVHPYYSTLLQRLKASSAPCRLLDLGTCLGQDLRKLVADGADVSRLCGADLFPEYEDAGHRLFKDGDRFRGRFFVADLLDDSPDSPLNQSAGSWDFVNVIMFLHIWDWDGQVKACKRILKLLSRKPGSKIIGAMTGSTQPGELVLKPPVVAEGEKKSIYRHDLETFKEMWRDVERDENIQLDVQVVYGDQKVRDVLSEEEERGERAFFFKQDSSQRRLFFTIGFM
ncbi:hypothetical protein ACLMJK_007250 [Lecanora helva]